MKSLLVPCGVFLCFVVVAIVQRSTLISRLPEQVAAHIGLSGEVDRWQDRTVGIDSTAEAWFIVSMIYSSVVFISLLAIRYLPQEFVNLPEKKYWLANPDRRKQVIQRVLCLFIWIAVSWVGLGIALTEDWVAASQTGQGATLGILVIIGSMFVYLGLIIVWFYRSLSRKGNMVASNDSDDTASQNTVLSD